MRYRFQQGRVTGGHHRFLGYKRSEEGSLEIIPDEADIVRRIFREFIEGNSPASIAKRLTEDGAQWRFGDGKWRMPQIKYILSNEKYMGTLLLQKYYTEDYLTKKVCRNKGEVTQYLIENNHAPIIPREAFQLAQAERICRSIRFQDTFSDRCDREVAASGAHALSGKVVCGLCGQPYRRKAEKGRTASWRCRRNVDKAYKGEHCSGRGVKETFLAGAVAKALGRLPEEEEGNLLRLYKTVMPSYLADIDRRLEERPDDQELLMQRTECGRQRIHIYNLLEKIQWIRGNETLSEAGDDPACEDMEAFLIRTAPEHQLGRPSKATDEEITRYVYRVIVYPDRMEVVFKAGVSVTVARI